MSDTTQQYTGRLYTQPEVERLIAQAVAEATLEETLIPETPCLADQPL